MKGGVVLPNQVFTVEEVANMLKLTEWSVRQLITGGKLKAFKIQRAWRIKEEDLNTFIQDNTNIQ